MTEKAVGKPWTQEEDNRLIQAVSIHGENDNWKNVSFCVPGRTNKACRKRWLHSLSPNVKKSAWTKEEDELLLKLYASHGAKWSLIARSILGRTDDACSKRYREALDPNFNRGEWTPEEDRLLLEAFGRLGGKWKQVGQELTRPSLACRNRWRMLERKRTNSVQPVISTQVQHLPPLPSHNEPSSTIAPSWAQSIPMMEATQYWQHSPQYPSIILQGDITDQLHAHSAYISPQYPSPSEPSAMSPYYSPHLHLSDLHDGLPSRQITPPPPPTFHYSSSSLSSALSMSTISSSPTYPRSPPSQRPYSLSAEPSIPSPTRNPPSSEISFMGNPQDFVPSCRPTSVVATTSTTVPRGTDPTCSVSFRDASYQRSSTYDCSASSSLSPRSAVQSYPTPMSSPLILSSFAEEPETTAQPVSQPSDSPSRHYRTLSEKKAAALAKTRTSKRKADDEGPRLSSKLPVTADPSILPYSCGHQSCWPDNQTSSYQSYATSHELCEHWKIEHHDDFTCSRPFRCGLTGCGKAWKSINGLQYHLQISSAHFQRAISASVSGQNQVVEADTTAEEDGKRQKLIPCPHVGCHNEYKQQSGLRYHLAHGHPQELPTQLDVVPPALARIVAEKYKGKTTNDT